VLRAFQPGLASHSPISFLHVGTSFLIGVLAATVHSVVVLAGSVRARTSIIHSTCEFIGSYDSLLLIIDRPLPENIRVKFLRFDLVEDGVGNVGDRILRFRIARSLSLPRLAFLAVALVSGISSTCTLPFVTFPARSTGFNDTVQT
jgi:hypothetical protein